MQNAANAEEKITDIPSIMFSWLLKNIWSVAEYAFKLAAWGVLCGALVAFTKTYNVADSLTFVVYCLCGLWVATFFITTLNGLAYLQDRIFETVHSGKFTLVRFFTSSVLTLSLVWLVLEYVWPNVLLLFGTILESGAFKIR